jgi:hypothetical protein
MQVKKKTIININISIEVKEYLYLVKLVNFNNSKAPTISVDATK